jgi:hypothetical protein
MTVLHNEEDKKKKRTMTVSSTPSSSEGGGGGGGGEGAAIAAAAKSLHQQQGNNGVAATSASVQDMQRTISRRRSSNGGGSHKGGTYSEDGSLSSCGMPLDADNERDEEKEVAKLARWETNNVRCWRTGVFLLLLILGATISTVAFVFFQQAEQEDFKVDVSIIYVYI